jgi:formiminoglutamase
MAMSQSSLPNDPKWPRAGDWIRSAEPGASLAGDLAIVGVPAHLTSITPTRADLTPAAVREALRRYSTFAGSRDVDLTALAAFDFGDVIDPDGAEGEARTVEALTAVRDLFGLVIALGGDNSVTYPVLHGLSGGALGDWGLVTVDAHHDVRDGTSNGSPVRRLVEAGLPGAATVQIGIADFANSAEYAARVAASRITVIRRDELRGANLADVAARALAVAGWAGRPVFVDVDVDVCDRAAAPGCPSAVPGGVSADELRQLVFHLTKDPRVRGMDITEVDAAADASDGRTVRLAALLVLEAATGLASR